MSAPIRLEPRLPDWLLQNRNFIFLWCAYGVAAIGDHLSEMALLTERGGLDRSDVTRVQALISFGYFLPFVILGPFAGWWCDRFSRRSTMIGADLLRALLVLNLAVIVFNLERWFEPGRYPAGAAIWSPFATRPEALSPPVAGWGDYAIIIPLFLIGSLAAFFSPARQAMLPTLVRDDQLVRANSLINALGTIGAITSGVVGGILVEKLGREKLYINYYLNAATFGLSALFVALILMSRARAVPHPPLTGVWTPLKDGFRYVFTHHRVNQLVWLGAVYWAAAGIVASIIPAIVKEVFQGTITDVAIYRGLLVVGLALGAGVMSIVGPALSVRLAVMGGLLGGIFWVGFLLLVFLFKWGKIGTAISLIGMGGAGAALLVTIMASLQRFVPDSRRGRVFGVNDMITMAAMVAATGALGLPQIPHLDRYIPLLLLLIIVAWSGAVWYAWREYHKHDTFSPVLSFLWQLVRFHCKFWAKLRRIGPCTIPPTGPVIVAANHTAGIDPILVIAASPRRIISYLVAEEYYNKPLAKWFMKQVECVPIDRKNPGKSFLVECLRTLREGRCLGIFPQGTFEEPGKPIPPPKSGAGVLALRTGAAVVPVHISGTTYHDNPFASYFSRHNARVRFGKPIDLSAFKGREKDPAAPDEVTALIMARIQELAPGPDEWPNNLRPVASPEAPPDSADPDRRP